MGLISKKVKIKTPIRYKPETKEELQDIIVDLLQKGQTNLNCIDTSKITDMSGLFSDIKLFVIVENIDISEWNVSNVTNMSGMFWGCNNLNVNISEWDVSNVTKMHSMFLNCYKFNCDLSNWNISNVKNMAFMFLNCDTLTKNNKIPDWY